MAEGRLHRGCILCKEQNVAKNDIIDPDSGRVVIKKGTFAINCDGILADPAEKYIVQIEDPRTRELLGGDDHLREVARLEDPVYWAYDNLTVMDKEGGVRGPFVPRGATEFNADHYGLDETAPYWQELLIRCSARRKLARIGRRSGKTWALITLILHRMFTNEGYRVLVVTPNISQLDLIFGGANEFLQTSPSLKSPGNRYVKTPQRLITLPNGSQMIGFVSGNESIRGQAADFIVIDEADYLTSDDLSGLTAIMSEHSEVRVYISSTPSGAREQFWKWDKDPVYRSFHYPSMCRPNWDLDMEVEQKKENPGVKFVHEILAEYGEISEGVFQHTHIDVALQDGDYRYQDQKWEPGKIYTMGVDWNPVHGTEIYVVGVDPGQDFEKRYKVADHGQVFREGNTQIQAVNEIVRLNRKWNPMAIYVDRGAGSVQVELLNEIGRLAQPNTADKRLMNIVEVIDFGSKIEMRGVRGGLQKVYAKPAVVENSVRMMEQFEIQLSKYDAVLERQLRGYIVDKIGANGRPVYATLSDDIADHALDALMLALFAFTMKFSKLLGEPEIIPYVGFTGLPGEMTMNTSPHKSVPVREGKKPASRAISLKGEDPVEEQRIEEERESRFLRKEEIRDYSPNPGAHPWISRQSETRRYVPGRRGGKGARRNPIRRSNIR